VARYYLGLADFKRIIEKLLERSDVYAPLPHGERTYFEKVSPENIESIVYDSPRPVDPPKSALFPARELVARYFGGGEPSRRPLTVIGVKGCDAAALAAYDRVMLEGDFQESSYAEMRKSSLIIGSDCARSLPVCFCTLVGLKPYPESGVDLNLSTVEGGFIVEVISDSGKRFFDEFSFFFRDGTTEELAEMENVRERVEASVASANSDFKFRLPIHEIVKGTLGSRQWREITRFCTECGACNISCPTCTCFTLKDDAVNGEFERTRLWDACLKGGYARVAGGANSRPLLHQRYNNRIQCKFDYSFERLGNYTCTGCGRCIEACPAKIDMREALCELERGMAPSARLK